jgi:hypothetical protein
MPEHVSVRLTDARPFIEAPVGEALRYEITGFLLIRRRSPTASETVLDWSVIGKIGNGLDDVHDLLRQPAAADGGHRSTIHLDGYGEVFDYQGVHFDSPRAISESGKSELVFEDLATPRP